MLDNYFLIQSHLHLRPALNYNKLTELGVLTQENWLDGRNHLQSGG